MHKETVKQVFLDYVKNYDINNPQINLKVVHTLQVADNAAYIAEKLNLSPINQDLAYVIGILHDIGRFEQVCQYGTFYDGQSVNHGLLGVEILKQDDFIRKFGIEKEYDEIIYCAVRNHNRYRLEEGLRQNEILHCNIIRDADKSDIFRAHCMETTQAMIGCTAEELQESGLSEDVYTQFMKKETIDARIRKTSLDVFVSHIALVFDINYSWTKELIQKQGYYEQMLGKYHFIKPEAGQAYTEICDLAMLELYEK